MLVRVQHGVNDEGGEPTPLLEGGDRENANVECVTETKCLKAIRNEDSAELDVNQRSPRYSGRSFIKDYDNRYKLKAARN